MSSRNWLSNQLCLDKTIRVQSLQTHLPDDLLVSAPVGKGYGGLAYLRKSRGKWLTGGKCVLIDRLGTTGLWLGKDCLLRSIDHRDYLMLIQYDSSGKTWPVIRSDLSQIHDLRIFQGKPYAVSTGTNEVACLTWDGQVEKTYRFKGTGDAWHLNCLDEWHGRLVVSAFGKFDRDEQWREGTQGKGFVMDVETQEIVWNELSRPHSPRMDSDGKRYVCDSETQRLLIKLPSGELLTKDFPGSFVRGLAVGARHFYVGLSSQRYASGEFNSSIAVFDRFKLEEVSRIAVPLQEIYDIVVCTDSFVKRD